jgi:hypothetical protein
MMIPLLGLRDLSAEQPVPGLAAKTLRAQRAQFQAGHTLLLVSGSAQLHGQIDAKMQVSEKNCLYPTLRPGDAVRLHVFITLPSKGWMVKMNQKSENFS